MLGNYHLLIAPIVARDLPAWVRFYSHYDHTGDPPTVILDNGAFERDCWPSEALHVIASTLANYARVIVCLPDVLGDGAFTYHYSSLAAEKYRHLKQHGSKYELMYICQGSYQESVLHWTEKFMLESGDDVSHLAVPRLLVDKLGSRNLITALIKDRWDKPIHLLGFSQDLDDDVSTLIDNNCVGIDSAEPIWFDGDARMGRPKDYFEWTTLPEQARVNIAHTREKIEQAWLQRTQEASTT